LRTAGVVRGFGCCSCLWTVHCAVDIAMCCGQCTVLWTVHCAVDIAMCCGECTVLWRVQCAVDTALCCGQHTVLWTVHCLWTVHFAVDSALWCGQCFETFWKRVIIREAGHNLPHIVINMERNCASTSLISLHDVFRVSIDTIHIGIVTN
jgi:hypothetical protein